MEGIVQLELSHYGTALFLWYRYRSPEKYPKSQGVHPWENSQALFRVTGLLHCHDRPLLWPAVGFLLATYQGFVEAPVWVLLFLLILGCVYPSWVEILPVHCVAVNCSRIHGWRSASVGVQDWRCKKPCV